MLNLEKKEKNAFRLRSLAGTLDKCNFIGNKKKKNRWCLARIRLTISAAGKFN